MVPGRSRQKSPVLLFLIEASLANSSEERFAVTCPHCSTKLKVKSGDLGSSRSCPNCQKIFALPSRQSARAAAAKREFSFVCRLCSSRIYARPEQVGQQVECPDCHTVNTVTRPAPKAPPKKLPVDDSDPYRLKPVEETMARPEPAQQVRQFRVTCSLCHALLYFRTDQIGTIKKCPDCQTELRVPKPQKTLSKPTVKIQDPGISFEPPIVKRSDNTNAQRVLERARAEVDEKAKREELPPIKHPFREGIWTFPFSLSGLPFCLVVGGAVCLVVALLSGASQMTGLGQIVGMLMTVAGIIGASVLFMISSVYWMTVVSWTAMGHRRVNEFPRIDMFEWIRTSLFIVNAGAVSLAPGALLAALVPSGWYRPLLALPSLFLFFPIILMSMLEDESPMSIYSKLIHDSLRKCSASWLKFYLIAGVLSVLVALPHILGMFFEDPGWNYVAAIVLVVCTAIYFRAFGRLAWVINEKMLIEREDDDDEALDEQPAPPPLPEAMR